MQLSPELEALAHRLAERHRIPVSKHEHPKVFVKNGDGTVDTFMTAKLREPHYVPYCLVGADCARVRRTEYGFKCPRCGNQMNWDLSHYDGNKNVEYDNDKPPVLSIKAWNAQVEARKYAKKGNHAYSNHP